MIICEARAVDGLLHVERLLVAVLPAESVRHAAMRLGKMTHPSESIGQWELWASAWHLIKNYGSGALAHADAQIDSLEAERAASGVEVWSDTRMRVVTLQATPEAWAGRA